MRAAQEILVASTLKALKLPDPLCIQKEATADTAISILRENNIGCLVVTNPDNDMMEGILTERDVVLKLTGREAEYPNVPIQDIMTHKVESVKMAASVGRALHMMAYGGYRHLPVIHSSKFPVGVLSARNLVDFVYTKLIAMSESDPEKQSHLSHFLGGNISVLKPAMIISVSKHSTVDQALSLLRENNVGCLAVTGEGKELEGIFSERDYILKVVGHEKLPSELKVFEVMTKEPDSGSVSSSVAYCFQMMHKGGYRHIPLTNRKSQPEFMVSVRDFLLAIADGLVEDLEDSSKKKKS